MKRMIIILLISCCVAFAFRWDANVLFRCGSNSSILTFGVDSNATDGYDPLIDVPTFAPPTGGFAYFPLNDPIHPGYTMLGTDYRYPNTDTIIWNFALAGCVGFGITWWREGLPVRGEFKIGAFDLASLPDTVILLWTNMRSADSIFINLVGGRIIAVGSPISAIAETKLPDDFSLRVCPNPFNSAVRISISPPYQGGDVRRTEGVQIEIFDIVGRKVARREDAPFGSAQGAVSWSLSEVETRSSSDGCRAESRQTETTAPYEFLWQPDETVGSGIYLVRATMHGNEGLQSLVQTKRVMYLK